MCYNGENEEMEISIHAPREGGDLFAGSQTIPPADFNPRPP